MLEPHAHHDLPQLPDDLAGEMGLLILLPAVPASQSDADAASIGQALAGSYGGQAHPAPGS